MKSSGKDSSVVDCSIWNFGIQEIERPLRPAILTRARVSTRSLEASGDGNSIGWRGKGRLAIHQDWSLPHELEDHLMGGIYGNHCAKSQHRKKTIGM